MTDKLLTYEVRLCMCDAIYKDKTQKTFKKRMDSHFTYLLRLLKNGQKSDSFSPISNSTLIILRHVHTCSIVWRSR